MFYPRGEGGGSLIRESPRVLPESIADSIGRRYSLQQGNMIGAHIYMLEHELLFVRIGKPSLTSLFRG